MLTIENLLKATPPDFIRSGMAHSPYCSLNETLMLANLSQVAVGKEKLHLGFSVVTAGSIPIPRGAVRSLDIPKSYFGYGSYSSLAINSISPELEGTIVGYNYGGIRHAGRHFFSGTKIERRYAYDSHPGAVLVKNLEKLGIKSKDEEQDAITALMALMAINKIRVGKNFESNIRIFGEWYKTAHPKQKDFYWRE